jgi:NADPH-dependent 2,4-dienoyl-CoA reductase/sulfur reductase-like enzyme
VSAERSFVIVGAGLTAASAADELRKQGFDDRVRVFGRERHLPYIRPPLSKAFLAGTEEREAADVHSADWYSDHDVEVTTGASVGSIDREAHELTLDDGSTVPYGRLLLATGSSARVPSIPGIAFPGVHTLRTVDDAETLKAEFGDGGKRVVLVGSGWIGMEVGATARTLGNEVTILDRGSIPLAGAIGKELGAVFARLHIDHGVDLRTGVQVERIDRSDDGLRVGLLGGDSVAADAVVVAVGATPNVQLAEDAELDVDDGVLVDERFTTSDPEIFAAGDIASVPYAAIGRRIRSEHWANAQATGRAAARGMLGVTGVYDDIPYFYTDQFDLGMEYSGYAPLAVGARVVYRGDVEAREFIAFWVADDRVVAGMNVNVWDVNDQVQRLIRKGPGVDLAQLTDPSVPLEDL